MITPLKVQERLFNLSHQIDENYKDLVQDETDYHRIKSQYEIAMARSRIKLSDGKHTAQGREDLALLENEDLHFELATMEAKIKATRGLTNKLKTQVEITRSISASIANEMNT